MWGGVSLGGATFIRNLVLRNWADNFGGGLCGGGEIRSNTFVGNFTNNNFQNGAGMDVSGGGTLSRNIVALSHGAVGGKAGVGIMCRGGQPSVPTIQCNDVWGNDGGGFATSGACDTSGGHNFS